MKLFTPARIGSLEVKNRLICSPMVTNYATRAGAMTDLSVHHYATIARGGVGAVVVEASYVDPGGNIVFREPGIWDDRFIPGLRRVATAITKEGARAFIQLHHAGRRANPAITGQETVAPSAIPRYAGAPVPHPLTTAEVEVLVSKYVSAALRARTAGFDGVDVHAGHGYLISQFLSPLANHRTDRFGGSVEGRARFLVEIVQGITQAAGPSFPVTVKLNGSDYIEGGLTVEESAQVASLVERAGVDAIFVTAGTGGLLRLDIDRILEANEEAGAQGARARVVSVAGRQRFDVDRPHTYAASLPMYAERGCYLELAREIKRAVTIPTVALGRIVDPCFAEEILEKAEADFIALARPLLADPEWPRKAESGHADEIRRCASCNQACGGRLFRQQKVMCIMNPLQGTTRDIVPLGEGERRQHVVVVGGGPAGMEAARVAALRGHRVTLVEQSTELGGQLRLAVVPPGRAELGGLLRFYESQLPKLGIRIMTGVQATPELLGALAPDSVVMATGAVPEAAHVAGSPASTVFAQDVLGGRVEVGARVVVVGGALIGYQTADHLAGRGHRVTLVDVAADEELQLQPDDETVIATRFLRFGVKVVRKAALAGIAPDGVRISRDGAESFEPADTVVLAMGRRPVRDLVRRVGAGGVAEIHVGDRAVPVIVIGDCRKPASLFEATQTGSRAALTL